MRTRLNASSIGYVEPALAEDVRFAFQPLVNLKTGGIVAIEALPRGNLSELIDTRRCRLGEWDGWLAGSAIRAAGETLLPLHVNLLASTIAEDRGIVDLVRKAAQATGRHDLTIEVGRPAGWLDAGKLLDGVDRLRGNGFRIAVDDAGDSGLPLALIADIRPDMVKLASGIVHRLERPEHVAVLEAIRHICDAVGATLLTLGVDNERLLSLAQRNGINMVQGSLLARPVRRPPTILTVPGIATDTELVPGPAAGVAMAGPRVTEFLSPATMMDQHVVAETVRRAFADQPDITGVVLVDELNRPHWTINRNRFLLAVTGPYGHALHAKRAAARLADKPLTLATSSTAVEALRLLTDGDRRRCYDDAVVVDEEGRCLGVVQAGALIRGVAELQVERAASLNPLTRLPGSDSVAEDVAARLTAGVEFAIGWLDIDSFKKVNDTAGFSAGDDLIRSVGRSLTDAAALLESARIAHVGGDDFLLAVHPTELPTLAEAILDPPREVNGTPVTLSLATLVCAPGSIASYQEASQLLAPLKRQAKSLSGSSWVRWRPGAEHAEVLRGVQPAPHQQSPQWTVQPAAKPAAETQVTSPLERVS